MDKFFLAIIGAFMVIFAVLKIQLFSSRRKADKAISESAKTKTEKDSLQTTFDVSEALARKLKELNSQNVIPPVVADALSDTPLEASATTLTQEQNKDSKNENKDSSFNKESIPTTSIKEDRIDLSFPQFLNNKESDLNKDLTKETESKKELYVDSQLSSSKTKDTPLSTDIREATKEQLKRIRQLRGL